MASFDGKFESTRQDWTTPDELFIEMDNRFHFTLDAAASAENTKVTKFFCEKDNSLQKSWKDEIVWLNPPYGNKSGSLKDWVKKSYLESKNGATVVMLIPARTNTSWFHDICLKYGEVIFVKGRPKFGGATHGLPQPLCFVVFRPEKV